MNEKEIYDAVLERFIRYVKIETTSKANCPDVPTTRCQFDLAYILKDELEKVGASDVWMDEKNCVVYGRIPSNIEGDDTEDGKKKRTAVGFIAHMDTSPDVSGKDVKPWVLENYQGGDVVLNKEENIVMSEELYPALKMYHGQDIVFTDGTTLLGGDDKAAIASLMTFAEDVIQKGDAVRHGDICIAFTPDEEVGGLAKDLDLERFGADIAYTIDGDHVGYYSFETFNATEAQLEITGLNVHPGTAKGIMVNAVEIGTEFISMLPPLDRPRYTEGREGYYHPHGFGGNVEKAEVLCLIRDHDDEKFDERMNFIRECVDKLNEKYSKDTDELRIKLTFANGYRSMRTVVEPVMYMIDALVEAITESGEKPVCLAFRGGTDGSAISQRGLPCPNISAGYENGHSRFEFVPVRSMQKNVEILTNLCEKLVK